MKNGKRILALLLSLLTLAAAALPAAASGEVSEQTLPFENSAFFETGEYRIHYRTYPAAEEKGKIFMIHGFALSSYCFTALAERLTEAGYTCVLADLPDFGYSTRDTEVGETRPREDLMHDLMTALDDGPWYVAGHSMGGYVALGIAQKYPESVKNLLLYGTSGNDGAAGLRAKLMASPALARLTGPMLELAGRCAPLVRLLYIAACADAGFALRYDVSKITDPYKIPGTGAGAILNFSLLPATDYAAVAAMPPILFLNGSRDTVIPDGAKNKLRAALPAGSRDVMVDGGGHMVIETHADEVAGVTAAFLADNP